MKNTKTTTTITSIKQLWAKYGKGASGRFICPITVADHCGRPTAVTHIYQGFGKIRLERIEKLDPRKKGFQGEAIYELNNTNGTDRAVEVMG